MQIISNKMFPERKKTPTSGEVDVEREEKPMESLPLRVSGVVFVAAHFPEVGIHGLFAKSRVLLLDERLLVSRHLRQIRAAGLDRCPYSCEACASCELVCAQRGGTFGFLAEEEAVTIRTLRRCYSVGTEEHLFTTVLGIRSRFT